MAETGSDEIRSSVVEAQTSPSLPTEKCKNHPSELLNMYCRKHRIVCCTVCITLDHLLCSSDVMYIKTAAANAEKSEEYFEVQKQLKVHLETLRKYNYERSRDKARLVEENKKASAKILDFKLKLQQQVDILADNALKEVDKRYEAINEAIVQDIKTIESKMGRIESQIIELEKNENECELFTSVIRGLSLTKECQVIEKDIHTHIGQEQIIVEEDQQVYDNICLKNSIVNFIDVNPEPVSTDDVKLLRVDRLMTTELTDKTPDKYCDIDDVCCLTNGNIVVTDKYNYKLFILDTSLEVKGGLVLEGKPSFICATAEDEIAVSIYANSYDYYITFFDLKDTVPVESRKLFLTKECRGLTMKDNTLVASYEGRLLMFTRSGELRKDVSYDKVERPGKIAFGSANNYLYIVDDKNGFVCYDHRSGKNIFVDKKSKNMKGMCVDKQSRIFLCDKSAQNIVQVTPHGDTVGTLLKKADGINYVKALCYDQTNDRLIVIMNRCSIAVYLVYEYDFVYSVLDDFK